MSSPSGTGDGPTVQAHRGFAGVAPENTVLAARTAAEQFDADWIEIDVQPTADGTVVCFHDAALHETGGSRGITDARGIVAETNAETVLAAEVLDSGQTVPRLADVLDTLPADVGLNIELKSPGLPVDEDDWLLNDDARADQRALWDGFVADVVEVLEERDVLDAPEGNGNAADGPLVFSSFFEGAIAAAAEHAPAIARAVIVGGDLDDGIAIARRNDAAAINASASLLLSAGESFVESAHDEGLAVNAWTLREWTTCRDLTTIGIDGYIADYPFLDATL